MDRETNRLSSFSYINYLTCARLYFFNEKYNKSLHLIDILLDKKTTIRKSLLPQIHTLYLMNHYKLGNDEYLPYAVKSLYRLLKMDGKLYAPEKALMRFLKRTKTKDDILPQMKELYQEFLILKEDKFNKTFFESMDYIKWLEMELQ